VNSISPVWWLVFGVVFFPASLLSAENPRAAVFADRLPGHDEAFARKMASQVSAAGFSVEFIGVAALTNAAALSANRFDLLVLPGAKSLPAVAAPAVESFLREGGDLLALGLPAWEEALFDIGGHWVSRAGFEATLAGQRPQRLLFDFANTDLREWRRTTDNPSVHTIHEIVSVDGGKALHVTIEKLTGWDTFMSPPLTNAFAAGQTLTCFRAKGSPRTRQLALEWMETDGSRWIATVNLTPQWKNYALTPDTFREWEPPPSRRGGRFRPANAARFVVGLAHSHTAVEGDQQEYWFANLGTAASPFGDARLPDEFKAPHLESVSPGYQFFPISGNAIIREARATKAPLHAVRCTNQLSGLHPRPQGVGFNQDRQNRWEPLLVARDSATDDYRGAIGALLVHVKQPFRGGVWAVFTPSEADFYQQTLVSNCVRQTLSRMRRGVFLTEGGAEFFTTFPKQHFSAGARVVNFGNEPSTNLTLSVEFGHSGRNNRRNVARAAFTLLAGQEQTFEERGLIHRDEENVASVTLGAGSEVIDSFSHELGVWRPKSKTDFIEARDGGLWRAGKPWKAHGVNYMPSSGIGLANQQHFEHWNGPGAYDPEVVDRDLRRIKAMNLNAVSVFIYHESLGAQHLLDFLRRCEALGIRVNLSLRPGTPLDFRWSEMRELIEYYRLAQNDTVFAYDLAWEPRHGSQAEQQAAYGVLWQGWVERRYGSTEAAQAAWSAGAAADFKSQISNRQYDSVPPMIWLTNDGPWRRLVADYRLFLDELLREKYGEARRLVKSIDPNHGVSFRMQHAGDSTFNWDAFLPYDFYGLAGAVDIWEPEAYGRIGDWEKVKPGRFTADYARLCDSTKPVVWAEMGYSVWDNQHMSPATEKLEFQARFFSHFYRMLNDSAADGIFFWWYPGGYRLNERSDFGIINPDGTDRPVTKIIRNEGGRFLSAHKTGRRPDLWLVVDRDRDARGLFGMYEAVKDEYWRAIATGKTPGLKWAKRPGEPAPAP
jgi:hypothetical protein